MQTYLNFTYNKYKMTYFYNYLSPLGKLLIATTKDSLVGIWFDGQKYFPDNIPSEATDEILPIFTQTKLWLDIYFGGKQPSFTPPLSLCAATPFRQAVWQKLLQIPYGKTATYGEIAKALQAETDKRVSAQAVGGAIGHNPISIVVPCHRVVGADGSLTGYAGGIDKKLALLTLEKADICFQTTHTV